MTERKATAQWKGTLEDGEGQFSAESGGIGGEVTFDSRFESGSGSNPEELIGAAEATCFAMALSKGLSDAGFEPKSVKAEAFVDLGKSNGGFEIGSIRLNADAKVGGGIDEAQFRKIAQEASQNSPVAKALGGVDIRLDRITLR